LKKKKKKAAQFSSVMLFRQIKKQQVQFSFAGGAHGICKA